MYNEAFGFSEKPFDLTPDPRFLFLGESHREALASMIYGINDRKGFISVSGKFGIGKTTLIHHLRNQLDQTVKTVSIFQTLATFGQVLQEIFRELGLPAENQEKGALIHQLNGYLIERLVAHENLALIIDEAQNLSKEAMEELRLLSNLETPTAKLLQIVLVGQTELEDKLNAPELRQLKQRLVIRRQIDPLSQKESGEYIDHRLKVVGSSASSVFTPEAVSVISRQARGIPRTINMICDSALLVGYRLSRKKVDVPIVEEALRGMKIHPPEKPGTAEPAVIPKTMTPGRLERSRSKPWLRKILFSAVAVVVLVLLFFLIGDYWGDLIRKPVRLLKPQPAAPPKAVTAPADVKKDSAPEPAKEPAQPIAEKTEISPAAKIAEEKPAPLQPPPSPQISPSSPVPSRVEPRMKVITVARGDNISGLCWKYYNLVNITITDYIMRLNPEITNPDLIKIRQKIKMPEIDEASAIIESGGGKYQIHLATFARPERMKYYMEEPALKGMKVEVIPRKLPLQGTWYRVLAGEFKNKEEALSTVKILKRKGLLPALKEE